MDLCDYVETLVWQDRWMDRDGRKDDNRHEYMRAPRVALFD